MHVGIPANRGIGRGGGLALARLGDRVAGGGVMDVAVIVIVVFLSWRVSVLADDWHGRGARGQCRHRRRVPPAADLPRSPLLILLCQVGRGPYAHEVSQVPARAVSVAG
jgi:hypothetical protein